jgi:hypothetical protein
LSEPLAEGKPGPAGPPLRLFEEGRVMFALLRKQRGNLTSLIHFMMRRAIILPPKAILFILSILLLLFFTFRSPNSLQENTAESSKAYLPPKAILFILLLLFFLPTSLQHP